MLCLVLLSGFAIHASTNVRIVAAPGGAAHAGLLEMETKAGGYGTVCGMNGVAADVFDFGVVSPAGCAAYGGGSVCGASGSPVAAKNVKCSGMVSLSQQMMRA